MTIYLVRHGQDQDNANSILNGHRDTELTELGRTQALVPAEKLKDKNIDVIYSSPLKRAYSTAKIIADQIGIDNVIIEPDLIETDFGILTGKPVADIPKYCTDSIQTEQVLYFLDCEGSEDFPTLLKRGQKVLEKITSEQPNKNIVIVAHGDIGKMIRAAYHNWTWKEGLMTPYFANTDILELLPVDTIK